MGFWFKVFVPGLIFLLIFCFVAEFNPCNEICVQPPAGMCMLWSLAGVTAFLLFLTVILEAVVDYLELKGRKPKRRWAYVE